MSQKNLGKENVTPIVPADPSRTWHINGHNFELDMQDAETLERYEEAFDLMAQEEKTVPKEGKSSVIIRAYCAIFRNLFNRIFGEGADLKIFGDKDNARVATEVYEDFLLFAQSQSGAVTNVQNRISSRYSPNRATRRAANKN